MQATNTDQQPGIIDNDEIIHSWNRPRTMEELVEFINVHREQISDLSDIE